MTTGHGVGKLTGRTRGAVGAVLAVLLALSMTGAPAGAQPDGQSGEVDVTRVTGGPASPADPRAIAIATCQQLVADDGAARVLLSRDDAFADALVASPLAGDDGCILFTEAGPADLDPRVREEIDRALPPGGQVELLGGVNAVGATVEAELQQAGYVVRRLEGITRYETAAAIAEVVRETTAASPFTEVVLAWGENWPDAVTAGAYAAAQGVPIVLTQADELHPAARTFLEGGPPVDRTTVVGGTTVIGDQVAQSAPNAERVAGTNRMGTAAEIARALWPTAGATGIDFVAVNLERDDGWTAALAAAPLSAQLGAPQIGVGVDRLPDETGDFLDEVGLDGLTRPPGLVVMGDQSFVGDAVADLIAERLGRTAGADPQPARCDPADSDADPEIPADATRVQQVMADIDGNGQADQLTTFEIDSPGGVFFAFHVLTTNGFATVFLLDADSIADVRPLGTSVIGAGSPAAFVVEQAGAGTVQVTALGIRDTDGVCELQRITIPDDQAGLRYTIGAGNGLQCRVVDGQASLVVRTATGDGPAATEFEWREEAYTWPGAFALQFVDLFEGTFTSPEDDAQIAAFSTIDCPGVRSP